jgi:hypothetical protein
MKIFSLVTSALLAFEAIKSAHAAKVVLQGSGVAHDTAKQAPRKLKKAKKPQKGSKCYNDSASFQAALTDVTNYNVGKPFVLTICDGVTIPIDYTQAADDYYDYVVITVPSVANTPCTRYSVIIKCATKKFSCGLVGTGGNGFTAVYYNQPQQYEDPQGLPAVLDLTLDGIKLSSSVDSTIYSIFALDQYVPTCLNTITGVYTSTVFAPVITNPAASAVTTSGASVASDAASAVTTSGVSVASDPDWVNKFFKH